jgi:hypothetical protein
MGTTKGGYDRRWLLGPQIDVLDAMGPQPGRVAYWLVRFRNPWDRVVRLDLGTTQPVKAWISGLTVAQNQRIHLTPGIYPLVLETTMPDPAPGVFSICPRLRDSDDVAAEKEARRAQILRDRDILERAVALLPGTPVADDAERLLKELR